MGKNDTRYSPELGERTDNLRRFLSREATFSDCGRDGHARSQLPENGPDARRQFHLEIEFA